MLTKSEKGISKWLNKYIIWLVFVTILTVGFSVKSKADLLEIDKVSSFTICEGMQKQVNVFYNEIPVSFSSSNPSVANIVKSRDIRDTSSSSPKRLVAYKPGKAVIHCVNSEKGVSHDITVTVRKHKFSKGKCKYCKYKKAKQITKELTKISKKKKWKKKVKWTNKVYRKADTSIPGIPIGGGYGCVAFALDLSNKIWGRAPYEIVTDYRLVQVGDMVRMGKDTHTVIIWKISGGKYYFAEGNLSGRVSWGRKMSKSSFRRSFSYAYLRGRLLD